VTSSSMRAERLSQCSEKARASSALAHPLSDQLALLIQRLRTLRCAITTRPCWLIESVLLKVWGVLWWVISCVSPVKEEPKSRLLNADAAPLA
jgi:hypothetical protein